MPDSDPPCHEFLWGSRAHAEINKMKALDFLAKIKAIDPTSFSRRYKEAVRDEEAKARVAPEAGRENPDPASGNKKGPKAA